MQLLIFAPWLYTYMYTPIVAPMQALVIMPIYGIYSLLYTMSVCIIGMASATSSSTNILKNPECFILTNSTQCYTELNEIPSTAEMVVATNKMVKKDDKQSAELVIGKEDLVPSRLICLRQYNLIINCNCKT